jgi:hypothetical protein
MIKPAGTMAQKPNKVNKFWMLGRDEVIGSGIPEKNAEWFVCWAQKSASSVKRKSFRSRVSGAE